ncbi:DUF305 domain-containing protein [Streptomyces atacamensis]|uniref:DUF305 domain-containing protein n=1 Tax=Streptomyces atacamensis TaxID=531966 RepID=UPI00399CC157
MNTSIVRRGAVAALAALALATAPAATAWSAPGQVSAGAATAEQRKTAHLQPLPTSPVAYRFGETLARLSGKKLEVTFFAAIIPHHRAAIEMARLERERGTDARIRTHADNIIANQRHQIGQFTRWLKKWYGLTPEQARQQAPQEARQEIAAMEKEVRRMVAELRKVPAGERFDIEFVRRMIPHHTSGIIEFLEPQSRADHSQLKVAAASGINTQEMQIVDFRTWLSEQTR